MELRGTYPKRLDPLLKDESRDQVVCAHRGWSKTLYEVIRCIFGTDKFSSALRTPKALFWIAYPTYKQGKKACWPMLSDIGRRAGAVKTNDTDMSVVFPNGSIVQVVGTDSPNSLRGPKPHGVCLDEWSYHDPSIYTSIIIPALADKKGWTIKGFTPAGKNFAYDDFIMSGSKFFYPADTSGVYDDEELMKIKRELSADEYAQEMLCQFLYHAGAIYPEFKQEVHVIKPKEIEGRRLISIDYGMRNPTAVGFYTIDRDDNIYLTDEIYQNNTEIEDIAALIKQKWTDKEKTPNGVIDPSTAAKDRFKFGIPYSVYQEFCDCGISLDLAPNSVLAGINIVKQKLTANKFFIFDRCEKAIWEMENYRWKEKRTADKNFPEEPLKVNDHHCDEIRYLVASQFMANKVVKAPIKVRTEDWFNAMRKPEERVPAWA